MKRNLLKDNITEMIILGAIILLGGILRIYTLGDRNLWEDEIAQVSQYLSVKSIPYLINRAAYHFQTPLDYMIGYVFTMLFGFSEFTVRFPAFLFGTFSLLPIYFLTRYIFSVDVAIIAVGITAISKWMIAYSQEARPYSIFIFFLFISLYFFIRALNENKKIFYQLYGISAFFMILSRGYEPLIVVFVLYIVTIGLYLRYRLTTIIFCRSEFIYRITRVNIIIGILYLPFIYVLLTRLLEKRIFVSSVANNSYYWEQMVSLMRHYKNLTFYPLSYFITLLLVLGILFIINKRYKTPLKIWFILTAVLLVSTQFIIYLKIANLNVAPFAMRYMIYWLPLIYIIISYTIVSISKQIGILVRDRISYRVISFFILLPIIIIFGRNTHAYYYEQKEDWRGSSSYIRTLINSNDIVWIETPWPYGSYGGYQPVFIGKPIYFPEIRDFSTDAIIKYVTENRQINGNVILVYYGIKTPIQLDNNNLMIRNFHRIAVISLRNSGPFILDNIRALLDEMENIYPEDSSRVRIYLAKARLLFAEKRYEESYIMIRKAKAMVPQVQLSRFSESVARFFPGLDSKQIE